MDDLFHVWGSDLSVGATGDFATAAGPLRGQQRVLRRLLSNPGDYIWQPDYGAGLAKFVGGPGNEAQVRAVIRAQLFMEAAVARTPEPTVEVQATPSGAVYVHVRYADSVSGETQILSFSVEGRTS